MEVVIVEDVEEGAKLGADCVQALLAGRPDAVLGVATGSSPEPIYKELRRRRSGGALDFSAVSVFMLDEYLGLPAESPASYRQVIERQIVRPLGIAPERVHGLDGTSTDPLLTCAEYEARIAAAGGVDLQLLGIGGDGHLGFNEPGSSLGSRTRIKTLAERTRSDNARFFAGEIEAVPRHVLTQGLATILEAKHLLLVAWGAAKAEVVAAAVEGPLTAALPASVLQLHPHATVLVDRAASSRLVRAAHYREVFAAKPAWQGL